jgi:predicted SprT family Zn-dependent metalloprotease
MRQVHIKNETSYGAKLLKSGNETYNLRRQVINIIYECINLGKNNNLKRLPRIEVRIVDKCECDVVGYAYLDQNIIHIPQGTIKRSNAYLTNVVLHEILHAIGFNHINDCPLLDPEIKRLSKDTSYKLFLKYYKQWSKYGGPASYDNL